jgi:hypothetical protein
MLVVEDNGTYTIVIYRKFPEDGIEYVDSNGKREAEIAARLFSAKYNVLGSVTISDVAGVGICDEMNK